MIGTLPHCLCVAVLCCYLSRAAAVLVAYPGATITGNDIDCGQQQGSKYPGSNAAGCTVCGSNLKGIEAACRRLPSCVAFVYDDASGCADLKSAAYPRLHPCSSRGGRSCRMLSLQPHSKDGSTIFVLLSLKGRRQQQSMTGNTTAATAAAVDQLHQAGGGPADAAATAAEAISAAAAIGR